MLMLDTYVMTTGATLLVMMDLALLLWMLTVWSELTLSDCLLSAIALPLPWTPSCGAGGCGAALAVVPILHTQLSITAIATATAAETAETTTTTRSQQTQEANKTAASTTNT